MNTGRKYLIKGYLQKSQKNDIRYDNEVNFGWKFKTMTDIWGDDIYTTILKPLAKSRFKFVGTVSNNLEAICAKVNSHLSMLVLAFGMKHLTILSPFFLLNFETP